MANSGKHGLAKYNAGCRCDQCKQKMSDYRKARRQAITESAGDPTTPVNGGLVLLNNPNVVPLTNNNTGPGPVETAVQVEIDAIGANTRPGLAATALELARVMDNSKALTAKPAAAAKLSDLLDQLRKGATSKKGKLASVRAMTSAKSSVG